MIFNGNYAKFLQNEGLRQFLIQTKNRVLVEASPYDKIWGIGMTADDEHIENPLEWQGQNLLGFALMEVRDELIRVCENYDRLDFKSLHEDYSDFNAMVQKFENLSKGIDVPNGFGK